MEQGNRSPIVPLIFKALALAMGVAVFVMGILGSLSVESGVSLLALGLAALALASLMPDRRA